MELKEIIEELESKQVEIEAVIDGLTDLDVDGDAAMRHLTKRTNKDIQEELEQLLFDTGLIVKALTLLESVSYKEPEQ